MNQAIDPLSTLIPREVIPHLEQKNMPYLGYHLFRHSLTSKLLGESEATILYWIGRDCGKQITIQAADDLVLLFIRLGLGKLDVTRETDTHYSFALYHPIHQFMSVDRLTRSLNFELGLINGAISKWRKQTFASDLELVNKNSTRQVSAMLHLSSEG